MRCRSTLSEFAPMCWHWDCSNRRCW